ncbi:cellulose-binding domain-containing protein [Streptomyces sporangiiformans]|uniref:Cellulose-binding protein n=1 Tax=Streptomyces sporangiiformans TaxID=2315329 RepID=A0A505D2E4_9ACTN|nr:cellulose-binding domain-containing protein [Streptomyces sporangiiformans]TPQ16997.1 cellulose-binding protein [Streptomyces sporangiiformans]
MPDLPTPQDAAEATLFSECWDAVLSYADLCTAGSATARQLASEAFSHGIREVRAAEGDGKNAGRRSRAPRLPRIPLLLTAVRKTADIWESRGLGQRLDPDLRLWLNSEKAGRYTGPPLHRPLALRGLRDMQEPDAALLWLAEVEAMPLPAVARRLGLDPESVAEELAQVRTVFRDRCHRNHLDTPLDAECRRYARLLDAVTRSPGADTPEDLSKHLATCVECAEAAACLRLGGTGLPGALASGVIGWGGLAYLERRRRAVESGLSRSVADLDEGVPVPEEGKVRIGRAGLLVGAGIVSLLALVVSLGAFDSDGGTIRDESAGREPVGDQVPPAEALPSATSLPPKPTDPDSGPSDSGSGSHSGSRSDGDGQSDKQPGKEPQGESSSSHTTDPTPTKSPYCKASYDLVNQWPDGFQGTVTVTSTKALDTWRVGWKFRNGQRVTQMWDGSFDQDGSHVTATAADYNRSVPAGGKFGVGFLASWQGYNSAPYDFTLNGQSCTDVS